MFQFHKLSNSIATHWALLTEQTVTGYAIPFVIASTNTPEHNLYKSFFILPKNWHSTEEVSENEISCRNKANIASSLQSIEAPVDIVKAKE
jgi:hypothetical protein